MDAQRRVELLLRYLSLLQIGFDNKRKERACDEVERLLGVPQVGVMQGKEDMSATGQRY